VEISPKLVVEGALFRVAEDLEGPETSLKRSSDFRSPGFTSGWSFFASFRYAS